MRKENNVQNYVIVILSITLLVMAVGFAAFSQNLSISSSTATFKKAKWDVHFDTTTFTETSTITASPAPTLSNTNVSFTVTLNKPGDVYSFRISAKNFGTIDAKMTGITMSGLTADQAKYVSYTITYAGEEYTSTTSNLNFPLAAEGSHSVVVTVKYLLPADAADLPSEQDQTVNLSAAFDYEDAIS